MEGMTDSELRGVLHQSLGPNAGFHEKRSCPRFSYKVQARYAPILKGRTPSPDSFHSIRCNDISAGGFSFFASSSPTFDELVVQFGTPPNDKRLKAKIV